MSQEPEWQRQQRETFIKWINNKLKKVAARRSCLTLSIIPFFLFLSSLFFFFFFFFVSLFLSSLL